MTYQVVRYFRDEGRPSKIVRRGLTLDQARLHCAMPGTKGEGWFDGYREVKRGRRKS